MRRCLGERWKSLRGQKRPFRIHTLHGESLGILWALRKFFKLGYWKAFGREIRGCLAADLVAAVHGRLLLLGLCRILGKKIVVHGNGWNSADILSKIFGQEGALSEEVSARLDEQEFFAYVGRGDDACKRSDRVLKWMDTYLERQLVAVPGSGFPEHPRIWRVGRLSPAQLREVYDKAQALIVSSAWEGGPLVALEALAQGCFVVSTRVGMLRDLATNLEGLKFVQHPDKAASWEDAVVDILTPRARPLPLTRAERATLNRQTLSSWREVTERLFEALRSNRKFRILQDRASR